MRIVKIDEKEIRFDNGSVIEFYHCRDCCEYNCADFESLDDIAKNYDYDENLKFEFVDGSGFRFGDDRAMFFVPCYSVQNGYYSDMIEIIYDGEIVLEGMCEEDYY